MECSLPLSFIIIFVILSLPELIIHILGSSTLLDVQLITALVISLWFISNDVSISSLTECCWLIFSIFVIITSSPVASTVRRINIHCSLIRSSLSILGVWWLYGYHTDVFLEWWIWHYWVIQIVPFLLDTWECVPLCIAIAQPDVGVINVCLT